MSVIQAIQNGARDYLVESCAPKQGCTLNMGQIRPHQRAIVDCDLMPTRPSPICDYIIACELGRSTVSVVEMKSGGFRASEVSAQLSSSSRTVENWLSGVQVDEFLPLLLSKGRNRHEMRVLSRQKVRFRGANYPIESRRCGARLRDLL